MTAAVTLAAISVRGDARMVAVTVGFALYLVVRAAQPDWLLRGLERYGALAAANVVTAAIQLAATWALIDGPEDFPFSSLPWLLSYVVSAAGIAFALHRAGIPLWPRGASWDPSAWWRHWTKSIHFTLSNGVSTLYQHLPLLYLYWQVGAEATGLFAAPFRLVIALLFVATVFPMTLYPVIADLETRGEAGRLAKLVAWSTAGTAVATGAVSAVAVAWAEPLLLALFGPEYLAAAPVLSWLALFLLLRAVRRRSHGSDGEGGHRIHNLFLQPEHPSARRIRVTQTGEYSLRRKMWRCFRGCGLRHRQLVRTGQRSGMGT